ncbi:MAG: phospho-N-acetylmuramoyl-pentapeptide-transferase [Ruminococcaceae bacterium]|nr:phospho-N-acetylmuramoyl-pentapeptide-transferase [Oscillospiraceae bacterium]
MLFKDQFTDIASRFSLTNGDLIAIFATLVVSFLLTVIAGKIILPVLRAKKVGQIIREDGPTWHMGKSGTPTMGGISFIIPFLLCMVAVAILFAVCGQASALIPFALVVCYAVFNAMIGFIDDRCKLLKKQNEGLTEIQKLVLQFASAGAFIAMMAITGNLTTVFHIPFIDWAPDLGWFAYPIYLLVLVGFVNATNITDGLDGLASSVCAVVAVFMTVFFILYSNSAEKGSMGFISASLLGGVLGFLVYNFHPAKMFMGDTGSLFLGAVIMGCAVTAGALLLFVLAGFVFVMDMLSSLIQRYYYKLTHGKRLFKMAPVHHHFEKCGWKEVQIVALFAGVSLLFCVLAFFGV